jgi:hypothetical protein
MFFFLQFFYPRGDVRMHGVYLDRPAGDALSSTTVARVKKKSYGTILFFRII